MIRDDRYSHVFSESVSVSLHGIVVQQMKLEICIGYMCFCFIGITESTGKIVM